ncbi:MAG: hypothetical protein Q8910_18135, partial [Bacteroidota bacterium]|nr:hypothetical protein [Bacteroidota bacterium]
YGSWTMKCECKEKNCRKVIGDYPTIPKSQRRKYIGLVVTPNFILEKLAREDSVSWDDRWTKIYGSWTMKCECKEKNLPKSIRGLSNNSKITKKEIIQTCSHTQLHI